MPLFDRIGRQASLTMAGEYILAHTRQRSRRCARPRIRSRAFAASSGGTPEYRHGQAPPSISCRGCWRNFVNEHPGVEIRLAVEESRIADRHAVAGRNGTRHHGPAPEGWPRVPNRSPRIRT